MLMLLSSVLMAQNYAYTNQVNTFTSAQNFDHVLKVKHQNNQLWVIDSDDNLTWSLNANVGNFNIRSITENKIYFHLEGGLNYEPFRAESSGITLGSQLTVQGNMDLAGTINTTSDGATTQLNGTGLMFNRTSSYLRPDGNQTRNLYIGGYADGSNNWSNVHIRATNLYWNDSRILTEASTSTYARKNQNNQFTVDQKITGTINPNLIPTNHNDNSLLTDASFGQGLSYHNVYPAVNYPAGTGQVWTFKYSNSRLHRLFFVKNSNRMYINSWHHSNASWNGWEQLLTNANYSSLLANWAGNLSVDGTFAADKITAARTDGGAWFHANSPSGYDAGLVLESAGSDKYGIHADDSRGHDFRIYNYTNSIDVLYHEIANDRVGIKTNAPIDKIHLNDNTTVTGDVIVDGNMESKKVKVSVNPGSVPDYVFQPEYKLRSLSELESYVRQNSHLPNIPNAQEMGQEGQDVGKLQLKLLEKIEELTLYIIDQDKKYKALEERMKAMEENKRD